MARKSTKEPYSVKHDWKGEGQPERKTNENGNPVGRPPKKRYSANWGGAREGCGRKRMPNEDKKFSKTVAFRIDRETEYYAEALKTKGLSARDVFVKAIADYAKAFGFTYNGGSDDGQKGSDEA